MRTPFTGVGTAIVTPFTSTLTLDEDGVRRLARRQIDEGVHFLVPCGTTGESPTLSEEERTRIVQICVEEARGKVPVLAGAGGYDTREVIHAARQMERAGANGLLSVTPYYNKPTPDGLIQHYKAIAESTSLPIIVYNVPGQNRLQHRSRHAREARGDSEHHRREGSVRQHSADVRNLPRGAVRLHRAVRRRCDYAAADGGGRPRRHLGRVERSASPDVADGRSRRARRFRGGAKDSRDAAAADADQFRRIQSHPRESRDGRDGAARRSLPAADGAAARGIAHEDSERAQRDWGF